MGNDAIIQLENKYYIAANSSYADNETKILNHIDTFGIFDRWGDIRQFGNEAPGIYHQGTRFLSGLEFRFNDLRPLLLSSAVKEENEILSVDLTNDAFSYQEKEKILKGTIHIARNKFVRNGSFYERIDFYNYGSIDMLCPVSLFFEADFRDIFEVRGISREKRGEIFEIKHESNQQLSIKYKGLDHIMRETQIVLRQSPDQWHNPSTALYHLQLNSHSSYSLEFSIHCRIGDTDHFETSYIEAHAQLESERVRMKKLFPLISTSNEQFNHWVNRSKADMLSLLAKTGFGYYPYAGVPWYNTPFGRDGIITALQVLWMMPEVARDVLLFVSDTQAQEHNTFSDAEPGKIFHEFRGGEMVETGEIPFKHYYGSVDSTPLFIVLAGAYYQRSGDLRTIKKIWKSIEAALDWINKFGDTDGDGFVEYHHKSVNGLFNQGWKDSMDSISHQNGELAEPPIALCEVQGYVYDAKRKASVLAQALGKTELAESLLKEAAALKKQFNERFWDEEMKSFVLALDGEKQPCRVKASNAGHTLYSGIADASKARRICDVLMDDEMFSGWGIRTLSKEEKRYNPMSYHNGSVWPHDVSIAAAGFARYGYHREALRLTAALFDASLFIELQRLPELFCGFERRPGEGPTAYPVACSPQAWAVASVFQLLEACLQIEIDGTKKKVTFRKPVLPDFIENIIIDGLRLGKESFSFELHRYKRDTNIDIIEKPGDWEVNWIR